LKKQQSDTDSNRTRPGGAAKGKAVTDKKSKWQQGLLSSGLILEHATARAMTGMGAVVISEYTYSRRDGDETKDFSCDLLVDGYLPMEDDDQLECVLVVPIECKYRAEKKIWLFMPDVNRETFGQGAIASVRSFPEFTPFDFPRNAVYEFMSSIPLGVKGTEIHLGSGETFDKDIKSGVNQLRYALPSIIESRIKGNADCGCLENAVPFFVCPILCTNAPLYILNEGVTCEEVSQAKDIASIAERVNVLDLYSNFGVDFEKHCASQTQRLMSLIGETEERSELYAKIHENAPKHSPWNTIIHLAHGLVSDHDGLFSQFLVCHADYLSELVKKLEVSILDDLKTKSLKKPWENMGVNHVLVKEKRQNHN